MTIECFIDIKMVCTISYSNFFLLLFPYELLLVFDRTGREVATHHLNVERQPVQVQAAENTEHENQNVSDIIEFFKFIRVSKIHIADVREVRHHHAAEVNPAGHKREKANYRQPL